MILWGAYVRATGSGAGCGAHWPLCNGTVVPRDPAAATLIELTHRLTSGLALLAVLALLWGAFRTFPRGHRVRAGAALTVFFMLTEAAIGAGLVLFEMVAENASMARALWMSAHLLNTFFLLAALAITAWWGSGGPAVALRGSRPVPWILGAGILALLVLGMSGAITALGDTLYPARSLAQGIRDDFSPTASVLVRLRVFHPLIALGVGLYVVLSAGMVTRLRPHPTTRRLARGLTLAFLAQIGIGFLNLALLAPVWLQLVHLLLADIVWVLLVLMTVSALRAPRYGPLARSVDAAGVGA